MKSSHHYNLKIINLFQVKKRETYRKPRFSTNRMAPTIKAINATTPKDDPTAMATEDLFLGVSAIKRKEKH